MPPELSYETLRFLRELVADEFGAGHQAARPVLTELDRALEAAEQPTHYTLRQESPIAWRLGALDGVVIINHGEPGNELMRGLGLLEYATAFPHSPSPVADFVTAAEPDAMLRSARTMLTRTRDYLAGIDHDLAALLKAVTVTKDEFGVFATYAPPLDAPPIRTGYADP